MDGKTLLRALARVLAGFVVIAALLFIPAGTWDYPNGWLLLGVLFAPMLVVGGVLAARAPELLRKRLNAREPEADQRAVIRLSALLFASAFVLAGLSFRFGWAMLPGWLCAAAAAVYLAGFALYCEVLRENAYLSRAVEIQQGQRVIDTGLYGRVRHPMYAATLLMFLCMPLILGAPAAFAVMLCYIPIILRRIRGEERVLEAGLPGYRAYEARVPWRLLPGIW